MSGFGLADIDRPWASGSRGGLAAGVQDGVPAVGCPLDAGTSTAAASAARAIVARRA
ncbi:MAG: hypothetical protein ACLP4R_13110 [Solirubrobacteraceae bacterium]